MSRALLLVPAAFVLACEAAPPCGLTVCDIRQPTCQRAAAAAAACLRGVEPIEVPVEVLPYETYLARNLEQARGSNTAAFALSMRGFSLLGLGPRTIDVEQAAREQSWAAAYYTSGDERITIIDFGDPLDSRDAVAILIHEYTHALQDRAFGIERFFFAHARDTDSSLAARAALEGEASYVDDLATVALFGADEGTVPWGRVFDRWRGAARDRLAKTKAPILVHDAYFVYPFGTPLVFEAFRRGGWGEVGALLGDRTPRTAREILGGAPLEPGAGLSDEEQVPALPPPYALLWADRFGAWLLETWLRVHGLDEAARTLPLALVDDVISFQRDPEADAIFVAWRLRFADAGSARALADEWNGRRALGSGTSPPAARVEVLGRDVVLYAAEGAAPAVLPGTFRPIAAANQAAPMPPPGPLRCPRRRPLR